MAVTEKTHGSVKKITWSWTSDASGDASEATTVAYDGKLIGLTTDPGSPAPTASYDIVVNDADDHDVLLGAGADLSATATEHVAEASLGAVADSKLTLVVSNAGNAAQGVAILYVR